MYDIIDAFINHEWISSTTGEQSYILALSGILTVILIVKFIDLVEGIFHSFIR